MINFNKLASLVILSFFIVLLTAPGSINAQEEKPTSSDEWKFALELYLWGASVGGETGNGSSISADFDDIIDKLDMAFMGAGAIRKGKWSLLADVIYLDLGDNTTVGPGVKLDANLKSWVVNSGIGYSLIDTEKGLLIALAGVRYLNADLDLSLGPRKDGDSGSNWDGIIGVKGIYNLTKNWYLWGYLDVGTGDSKITYQGLGAIGYRFNWIDLNGGYRYLRWDFDNKDVIEELYFHGPFAGIKFSF
jgi:hypothetical protein